MKKLVLVPVVLFAACTDNLDPNRDDVNEVSAPDVTAAPANLENPLLASFITEPDDCADNSVRLIPNYRYEDGTRPENVSCQYTLSDGTVIADTCFATPSLALGGQVTLTLTDLDTGAVGTHTDFAQGPASFATTLDVTTDGLTLSWNAHNLYGGFVVDGNTRLDVAVSPIEKVIVDDPSIFQQPSGTVTLTEAGSYTVTASGSISFAGLASCGGSSEVTVEATCDGTVHDH